MRSTWAAAMCASSTMPKAAASPFMSHSKVSRPLASIASACDSISSHCDDHLGVGELRFGRPREQFARLVDRLVAPAGRDRSLFGLDPGDFERAGARHRATPPLCRPVMTATLASPEQAPQVLEASDPMGT